MWIEGHLLDLLNLSSLKCAILSCAGTIIIITCYVPHFIIIKCQEHQDEDG